MKNIEMYRNVFNNKDEIRPMIPETYANREYKGNTDLISDGYHTFGSLYYQRAVLFATIVNTYADLSWKSFKHDDGKYCFDSNGEWFIVGISTPEGPYTYHYEKKYWDLFKCRELEVALPFDGHTEKDVVRLLSLL